METCQAAAQVSGGAKACAWGCLGFGDCKTVCKFDAITMSKNNLPEVNEQLCTACGDCVKTCPKDLFSLQAINRRLWIACRNEEAGDNLLQYCEVAKRGRKKQPWQIDTTSGTTISSRAVIHIVSKSSEKWVPFIETYWGES